MNTLPSARDWSDYSLNRPPARNQPKSLDEAREAWDERAPWYARKRERSGYLAQLTELLDLQPGETVLDFGCGPGVLSVPLAQQGHDIVAVDFSDGMLEQLKLGVKAAGVEDRFRIYRRAWQESWDGIPQADVAVSSRSMTTHDLADAIAKLESKARDRVVVTTEAGESPWFDARLRRALGREVNMVELVEPLVCLVNYLFAIGRYPEVRYITCRRATQSDSLDELRRFLFEGTAVTPEEQPAFDAYLEEHVVPRPGGGVMLDYQKETRWAYICWKV